MQKRVVSMVILGVLLSSAGARAESRPSLLGDYLGDARSDAVELELGWFFDSELGDSVHALAPVLSARVSIADNFDLELDWPFAFVSASAEYGGDQFRSGNPLLAGYYVSRQPDGYMRVGFGLAPPIASADGRIDVLPLAMGVALRGFWDSWLYVPETLSLVFPFQIERRNNGVIFGADTALAALIPTGDSDEANVAVQLAGLVGGTTGPVSAGIRLQLAWLPTSDGDNAQVALVPFVQGDFSAGFAYLRFLINLDEPFGVFGEGADVWMLAIGGGARF